MTTPSAVALPGTPAGRGAAGLAARAAVVLGLAYAVLALPAGDSGLASNASLAAIYAIVGISLNVLVGYTGQISLGQQGFVGIGALVAANVAGTGTVRADPFTFGVSLVVAAAVGAATALLLGAVALRIRGLYLALVTLVFGSVTADAVFTIPSLNGQAAGVPAYRPAFLAGNGAFYLFTVAVLAVVLYLDWALTRSKAGRAVVALRENELVAQAFAVNVTGYKLLAFALSGTMAGVAGGLFAFRVEAFSDKDFTGAAGFNYALIFLVMVVVGGLGSRAGVVVASAFFGLLDPLLGALARVGGFTTFYVDHKFYFSGLIGSTLLLVTILANPGGTGSSIRPLTRWLAGGRFSLRHDDYAVDGHRTGGDVRA